jgi:hypothetical protein
MMANSSGSSSYGADTLVTMKVPEWLKVKVSR